MNANVNHSLEVGVLACLILKPETLVDIPHLEVDDFLDAKHRMVFKALRNLEAANKPIDVVTVCAEVSRDNGHSDHVTLEYLGGLVLDAGDASEVAIYARHLREAGLSRRVQMEIATVLGAARSSEMAGTELLGQIMGVVSKLDADQGDSANVISRVTQARLRQLMAIAEDRANGKSTMTGFPTGVASLDEKIGGVQPGIVTIVAARPGMGKSSFGLAIADACSAGGFGVHLFSLEDTEEAYADRTISRLSRVPAQSLRNADLTHGQQHELAKAVTHLRGRRWIVDGRSGVTADEIVRSVRRHRRENATNVVIVDYVQLVKRAPRMSPHEALGEIITTLADAAKHDRMAYVVMSQLNRGVEQRQDKRPQLSDLRESGSLEERAKCVIGLYRGAYYGPPVEKIDYVGPNKPDDATHASTVQLCVLKNSNGRTGTVWANWDGPTTRIS